MASKNRLPKSQVYSALREVAGSYKVGSKSVDFIWKEAETMIKRLTEAAAIHISPKGKTLLTRHVESALETFNYPFARGGQGTKEFYKGSMLNDTHGFYATRIRAVMESSPQCPPRMSADVPELVALPLLKFIQGFMNGGLMLLGNVGRKTLQKRFAEALMMVSKQAMGVK